MSKNKKHYSPKPNFPNKTTSTVPTSTKKKNTRKKLSFWLVVSFLIICGVGSILGSYSFVENRVKADTSVTAFFGANVNLGVYAYKDIIQPSQDNFLIGASPEDYPPDLSITSPRFIISPSGANSFELLLNADFNFLVPYYSITSDMSNTYVQRSLKYNYFSAYSTFTTSMSEFSSISSNLGLLDSFLNNQGYYDLSMFFDLNQSYARKTYFNYYYWNNAFSSYGIFTCVYASGNITSDIVGVEMGYRNIFTETYMNFFNGGFYNYITYHCSNGNFITFAFSLSGFSTQNYYGIYFPFSIYTLDYRYYITSTSSSSDYQAGLTAGRNESSKESYDQGFDAGKIVGENIGYQNGYSSGLEDSQSFNFFSLMASVVDAPVQAVTGLLDFNIFGFNMQSVFFGFLTIALVVFVIRKLT